MSGGIIMTQNQINLAVHNETVRHNKEMERQGNISTLSNVQYQRDTGSASLRQASAAESQSRSAAYNAQTQRYSAIANDENTKYANYTTRSTRLEELKLKKEELENQKQKLVQDYLFNTATINARHQANKIAQQDADTRRTGMFFNAINGAFQNVLSLGTGFARTVR